MLKITRKVLNNKDFLNALRKIREYDQKQEEQKQPGLSASTKLRIGLISQACYFEMLKAQEDAKALLKTFAMKDENGEIYGFPDETKIKFENTYLEHKHDEAFNKMLKIQIKIDCQPINVSSLDLVGLSTAELTALRPILRDI